MFSRNIILAQIPFGSSRSVIRQYVVFSRRTYGIGVAFYKITALGSCLI